MINRRILIFGIIAILGISTIKLGTNLVKDNILGSQEKDLEIVRSDEENIKIVEDDDMRKTVFYFKNQEGYLVPVMKKIPWNEGIAKATLTNMVDTEELREDLADMGLLPLIPAGTKIHGISVNEETGLCKVDFSEDILNIESTEDEENLIKGIVYTLTEFSNIEEVQIMVEGKIIPKLKNGLAIAEPLARENINLLGKLEEARSKVIVYFKDDSGGQYDYYIPVTIPTMAQTSNIGSALDALFQGPPAGSNLATDLPINISLEGVDIKDGTAYVDLSSADNADINDRVLGKLMKNIGLTLREFKEIENLELMVDGKVVNDAIPVFANEY